MKLKKLAAAFSLIALTATLGTVSTGAFAAAHGGAAKAEMMAKGAPVKTAGGMLVGNNSMTLYTFDKDAGGKSMCNGGCAANWPPLAAAAGDTASGDYSIITRDDGSKQWAFKGKPLYFWVKDQKAGDKTGDGFKDVWHVVKQ